MWNSEDLVLTLLGDRVTEVDTRRQTVAIDQFPDPEASRHYFKAPYGPTVAASRGIGDDR